MVQARFGLVERSAGGAATLRFRVLVGLSEGDCMVATVLSAAVLDVFAVELPDASFIPVSS